MILDFLWPGKSTDNGFIEASNSKFREERLKAHWFVTFAELENCCRDYNEVRPHSTVEYNVSVYIHDLGSIASRLQRYRLKNLATTLQSWVEVHNPKDFRSKLKGA